MGTTWGRLVGDTGLFAIDLTFHDDPHGGHAATAEDSLSWGALQLWVSGQNICAYTCSAETSDAVLWYLLPLLEWIADNWNPLLHEEKLPERNSGDSAATALGATEFPPQAIPSAKAHEWEQIWHDWWKRHCLLAARQGGVLPNLFLRRWRDQVELSWLEARLPGVPADLRFMTPCGLVRISPDAVAGPLHATASEAAKVLSDRLPRSKRLKKLVAKLDGLSKGAMNERLAWIAGIGTSRKQVVRNWNKATLHFHDTPKRPKESVLEVEHDQIVVLGSNHAALMFGSLSPTLAEDDIIGLAGKLVEAYDPTGDPGPLRRLREKLVAEEPHHRPWEQGYRLAEQVLEVVGLGGDDVSGGVDIHALLKELQIRTQPIDLTDPTVRAASIAGTQHHPTILTNESYEPNRTQPALRFSLAHELCHILADRDRAQRVAIASGPWAPLGVEQRANAFAAMLLMPETAVQSAVRRSTEDVGTLSGIRTVARFLNTSPSATLEHLCNLGIIDEPTRDQIRQEAMED